jgi:hypothetical protein
MQFMIDQIADRAFAAGTETGEPDDAAFVLIERFALFAANTVLVPMNVNFFVGHGCGNSSGRYNWSGLKARSYRMVRGAKRAF